MNNEKEYFFYSFSKKDKVFKFINAIWKGYLYLKKNKKYI